MHMTPKWFKEPGYDFDAEVNFKNGNTEGTQKFVGENFLDLFNQIAEFLKRL